MFDAVSLGSLTLDKRLVRSATFELDGAEGGRIKVRPKGQLTLSLNGRLHVDFLPLSDETTANTQAGM